MLKLTDLTCYYNKEFSDPHQLIASQHESLGYAWQIRNQLSIEVIKHTTFERTIIINNLKFHFFKGRNGFAFFSRKTANHLRASIPNIILLQGLIFPLQVFWLRWLLGKKLVIIAQHHGEQPFPWHKRWMQKIADKYIRAYIFTSLGNARSWWETKIIKNKSKCYEVMEASTGFLKQDKKLCKIKLGLSGHWNFLWVGRLNANKDPLTVLQGFQKFLAINSQANLHMIYQDGELLDDLKARIGSHEALKNAVHLVGKIKHEDLPNWYSATDMFISGSHREGSGFALIEAMACGCIPVITDIPTFRKITDGGRLAFLYEAGNSDQLFKALSSLPEKPAENMSAAIVEYFEKELSFQAIADKLYELCTRLT